LPPSCACSTRTDVRAGCALPTPAGDIQRTVDKAGDGLVDAATPRADDPGPFTCCVARIAINALPCQVGAASFFPSGNQVVRLPVSGPGLPDRMRLASQGSFDGHPWLWLPIKNHGKGSCAILTHRPCTIGLTRRKLQRPPQVIAVCWHPPSGLGYCPRPSPRARPSSVAPGDLPAASPRLPHPFYKCGFGVAAVQHGAGTYLVRPRRWLGQTGASWGATDAHSFQVC
jgi:hypothetical protein